MSELFIIIVILLVLWFINNNTNQIKPNKLVSKEKMLPDVTDCYSQTCPIDGQICLYKPGGADDSIYWVCENGRWIDINENLLFT
jgi:hypothetical protein